MPKIKFSSWFKWNDRIKIENINSPGVYLLAKFKRKPGGNAKLDSKHIIYIGETCDNSLRGRWNAFNRAAFRGKAGHSGGLTYYNTYRDSGDDLYVAALAVQDMPDNLRHLFIRFIERKLIYEFALKHGSQPDINRK